MGDHKLQSSSSSLLPRSSSSPNQLSDVDVRMHDPLKDSHDALDRAEMNQKLERVKGQQKIIVAFFMFLTLALIWIANGVLMDPLWQTTTIGNKHIMSLHKDTQVGMIKMFSIVYWIFMALTIVMSVLTFDRHEKGSSNFLTGIFYLCIVALTITGLVGAGYLTAKVWKAKQDPTNKRRVLLTFSRAQLTTIKIMCIMIWSDIVFAALLFIGNEYKLK